MVTSKFELPSDLTVPDFWKLPGIEWKNITKYDFRYVMKTVELKKDMAHAAYSSYIQKMLNVVKPNTNLFQNLNACRSALNEVKKNKQNSFFWETEAKNVVEIAMKNITAEEELDLLDKLTAIDVLKDRRRTKKNNEGRDGGNSSSSSSVNESSDLHPTENNYNETNNDTNNNNQQVNNENSESPKRKNQGEEGGGKKRLRKESTILRDFLSFKRDALLEASSGSGVCNESHIHHLLALHDILLLTPKQYPESMRNNFGDDLLDQMTSDIANGFSNDDNNEFGDGMDKLSELVFYLQEQKKTIIEGIQGFADMTKSEKEAQSSVIIGLMNMIQKLPRKNLLDDEVKGETELWSTVYDPMLTPMFSRPEGDVLLRWSNVLPSEGSISKMVQVRPDAIICQIDQLKWGILMGFGEVKLAEPTSNADVLGQDLVRLSMLGKNTLMKTELKTSISFQIHGYKLNVFVSKMIPDTRIAAMVEIESITFPRSMEELHIITNRTVLKKLIKIYNIFWNHCYVDCKRKKIAKDNESINVFIPTTTTSPVLDISTLDIIRQRSPDRHRICNLRY